MLSLLSGMKVGNTQFGNDSHYSTAYFQETKLIYIIGSWHWFGFFFVCFVKLFEPVLINVIRIKCKALNHIGLSVHQWSSFYCVDGVAYYLLLHKHFYCYIKTLCYQEKKNTLPQLGKHCLGSHCLCLLTYT